MKANKPKPKLSAFFTRQKANEGIKLPLSTPDGQETEHYIKIRGIDSDAYKLAVADSRRRVFQLATVDKVDEAAIKQASADEELNLLVALVMEWSFAEPCTAENVRNMLIEAPQIKEQIDRLSARRTLFFANSLKSSTDTPAPVSS